MLDWADDAREQTDTRIMDVLQTPCLKRQKPLQAEASSVSYLLLCVLPQSGERKEGWSEPGAGGQFLCSNVPVGLSRTTVNGTPKYNARATAQEKEEICFYLGSLSASEP